MQMNGIRDVKMSQLDPTMMDRRHSNSQPTNSSFSALAATHNTTTPPQSRRCCSFLSCARTQISSYMFSPTGSPRMTMLWKYSITPESETFSAGHCGQSNVSFIKGCV